ncbi:MAG: DUF6602 domain-containing protein [Candidatus Accumulibacter propinquus]|jgi:hypothetical protein
MPRGANRPSAVFKAVLEHAKKQLEVESNRATSFQHRGVRGDERAAALANFFRQHLPESFGVAKGEAIDYLDHRTGQLDILIFDSHASAPIATESENILVPAEGLLAIIEVKSILNQDELGKCFQSAKKVRQLKPFKKRFISARDDGRSAEDGNFRCLYIVFAYDTNLTPDNWMSKEFERMTRSASEQHATLDCVDIVAVLNRGLIRPGDATGKENNEAEADTFLEFYLHVVNFLNREQPRRPAVDWQTYTTKTAKGWVRLNTVSKPNE